MNHTPKITDPYIPLISLMPLLSPSLYLPPIITQPLFTPYYHPVLTGLWQYIFHLEHHTVAGIAQQTHYLVVPQLRRPYAIHRTYEVPNLQMDAPGNNEELAGESSVMISLLHRA